VLDSVIIGGILSKKLAKSSIDFIPDSNAQIGAAEEHKTDLGLETEGHDKSEQYRGQDALVTAQNNDVSTVNPERDVTEGVIDETRDT